ncbi:alpha-glucosidase/alpha-galactosidase [Natronolimnobius baerhuensis]|uniref:Alpha-glucosidase/alpha-galactosidase n=1 Tax=Natronolimnobius baerhuensis TaxID=253108 RepID=A0A202E7K0_9EURY|nr:alpha-glucosidase/alpha-galactosidase [Natronolimnobius baerhuensis]OVE84118.1 alpha-glucosidase/alpha-galactosidase [Natronolimnobius baerhuensis]
MAKITFIGAGSMVFAKNLIGDILSFEALEDSTLALMDIDEQRLAQTTAVAEALVENGDVGATIESTTDRREALEGADYVLNMINVGGTEPFENEIRIPERYGVEQAIGDTLGPGGIFRGLRTIPTMLEIAADMEAVCPDALLLNYTNPMAIVCWVMFEATDIETVGLCHSVPHTVDAIAEYIDVPSDELEYWVAGINHMAWFLECTWQGEDVYPQLQEALKDEGTYEKDTVRFELLDHFGAFVTESSHHNSEYHPYFRTDSESIEQLAGTNYAGRMPTATYLEGWLERSEERDNAHAEFDPEDVSIERSEEYASRLIHSLETGTPRRLNLNVDNEAGHIQNLRSDACVEVPCLVDGTGVHPCSVGTLPPQLAALNRTNVNVQRLAVKGALEGNRDAIHQAVTLDPLTAATLSLEEIHEMTEELLEANDAYLPDFS